MIRRLYAHNYRCLENFDLRISGRHSVLLIGKNGSGKTTVGLALRLLQRIARGQNQVGLLIKPEDMSRGRMDAPVRFELEADIEGKAFSYSIAFEYPKGFKELRVLEEKLSADNKPVYTRQLAQVHLAKSGVDGEAKFLIDWHLVALPIIQEHSTEGPLTTFKQWLGRLMLLRPVPSIIKGDSEGVTLWPLPGVTNFGEWFSGVMAQAPYAYGKVEAYLKLVLPDFKDIKNPLISKDSRSLEVQFSTHQENMTVSFRDLSDGEKCLAITSLVIAANDAYGPLVCFWDEPENFLAPSEVGHSVLSLRKAFETNGQFIATSHNAEAISRFSDENTLILFRNNHLEPTVIRPIDEFRAKGDLTGDLVEALVRGDLG